ncbi:leucine-rich repeat-containing protein 15-like [Lytechinus variegatus]|uniref:leucine-rich repeat-containing protein 15-like n=1 Tax=Lytechinus variegatus TaxID=7654 RepID=UPI001BB217E2|nr:leucine-rich repeat-containing protein 15-like [Lytechinus variegatus]
MGSSRLHTGRQFRDKLVFFCSIVDLLLITHMSSISLLANAQYTSPKHSSCPNICQYDNWTKIANCSNRQLTAVPGTCNQARTLKMNNNRITRLNPYDLEDFTNLQFLYLGNNRLDNISSNAFVGLGKLEYLRLGGNCFSDLNGGMFRGLAKLQFLLVVEGCLENIAKETFKNLQSLGSLELGGNHLREPPCDAFGAGNVLRSLSLSNNLIFSLPQYCFAKLHLLRILDLSGNNLTEIRNSRVFSGLDNLETLSLDKTNLVQLAEDSFINIPQIRHLYLKRNRLSNLPINVFANLVNLTFLNLSDNALDRVTLLFQNNLRLEIIDLSSNMITWIDPDTFKGLKYIQTVLLSSNRLKKVYSLIFETPWINITNLADNPLNCECAIMDLGDWLDRNPGYEATCDSQGKDGDVGRVSLQSICDEYSHPSSRSGTLLVESQGTPKPSTNIYSTMATKPQSHGNSETYQSNTFHMTTIILIAIIVVIPVLLTMTLFGTVYYCQRILSTTKERSKDSFILTPPTSDPRAGLIVAHPPSTSLMKSTQLIAIRPENGMMARTGDDDGVYEEFSDVDPMMKPSNVSKKTNNDGPDFDILHGSHTYLDVQDDTYVPYDPPRLPDRDNEYVNDIEKRSLKQESGYYVFSTKEPVYDSKIPKYVNESELFSV